MSNKNKKYGIPTTFRARLSVYNFIQKKANISEFLNNCVEEYIRKNKEPREILKSLRKEQLSLGRRISKITQNIEIFESKVPEMGHEDLEKEKIGIMEQINKDEIVSFLEDDV